MNFSLLSNVIILFSPGQDSSSLFFLNSITKRKLNFLFFYLNHETQLNLNQVIYHILGFLTIFSENSLIAFLPNQSLSRRILTEEDLRFCRYQSLGRLSLFSDSLLFLTAHTESDQLETFYSNIFRINKTKEQDYLSVTGFLFQTTYSLSLANQSLLIFSTEISKYKVKKFLQFFLSINVINQYFVKKHLKASARLGTLLLTQTYSLPLFVDKTNFSFSYTRNRLRRHLMLYTQNFLSKKDFGNFVLSNNFLLRNSFSYCFKTTVYLSIFSYKDKSYKLLLLFVTNKKTILYYFFSLLVKKYSSFGKFLKLKQKNQAILIITRNYFYYK